MARSRTTRRPKPRSLSARTETDRRERRTSPGAESLLDSRTWPRLARFRVDVRWRADGWYVVPVPRSWKVADGGLSEPRTLHTAGGRTRRRRADSFKLSLIHI